MGRYLYTPRFPLLISSISVLWLLLRVNTTFDCQFAASSSSEYLADQPPRLMMNKAHNNNKRRLPTPSSAKEVGTLNGFPLYHVPEQPHTSIHCVGENFRPLTSVLYRNCEYQNLCFDLQTNEYVIWEDDALAKQLPHGWLSSTLRDDQRLTRNLDVSSQPRNGLADFQFMEKSPQNIFRPVVRKGSPPNSHYYLDVAQLIFFRYKIGFRNPGHHGWQELVSLFSLVDGFGHYDETMLISPLKKGVARKYMREGDKDMMNKIGSKAFGHYSFQKYNPYWTDGELEWNITNAEFQRQLNTTTTSQQPHLVCSKLALTGMGQVGAHATHFQNGTHKRPRSKRMELEFDIEPYHHGQSGFFRRMRDWMLRNLGIDDETENLQQQQPAQLLFAMNSSTREPRASLPLDMLMTELQPRFPDESKVVMESKVLHQYSIEEQALMISRAKVLFIAVGGGTFPAIFLRPGSHLVLFYDHELLDWDYWNNIAHIKVHWIPYQHVTDPGYKSLFESFISEITGLTPANASPDRWGQWPGSNTSAVAWDDVNENVSTDDPPVAAPSAFSPSEDDVSAAGTFALPKEGTSLGNSNATASIPKEGISFFDRNPTVAANVKAAEVAFTAVSNATESNDATAATTPGTAPSLRGTPTNAMDPTTTTAVAPNVQNSTAII